MTFNIPIQSRLISTSVNNENPSFNNTLQQVVQPNARLTYLDGVFINATANAISFPAFDAGATYVVGDITYKDGKIKRLASIGETLVLKEPWEYDSLITGGYCLGGLTVNSPDKGRYWEPFADPINNYPQSSYFNITNDLGNGAHYEILRDGNFMRVRIQNTNWDEVARVETNYCSVAYSVATMAVEGTGIKSLINYQTSSTPVSCIFPILVSSAVYISPDGRIIFLSNPAYPYEYKTITTNVWEDVISPATLGMTYSGVTRKAMPFDTKQYTSIIEPNEQSWTIESQKPFNGVAIGNLRGSNISVTFKNAAGTTILTVSKTIQGSIDANLTDEAISEIIYVGQFIEANGTIEMTITGTETEVGFIFPSASIDVGITDLEFSHDIINFDRTVVSDISGYVDRVRGNRVIDHKGSFHIAMQNYDNMVLLNKKLTQEIVAIDGSDMISNEVADSFANRFSSTKIICQVRRLSMKTRVKDNDIAATTKVDFEFREIV